MTEEEAIATANEAAEAAGAILADFNGPKARREEGRGEWVVFYQGKKLLVGNHFMVVVDDGTGQVRLVPGA